MTSVIDCVIFMRTHEELQKQAQLLALETKTM